MPTELNTHSATLIVGGSHNPHTPRPIVQSARDEAVPCDDCEFFGEDGFTFEDIIDAINPLQQLPGISSIYREASGDGISTVARLAGGAIFGGPIGFAVSAVNAGIEMVTGEDVGGHIVSLFSEEAPVAEPIGKVAGYYSKAAKLSDL